MPNHKKDAVEKCFESFWFLLFLAVASATIFSSQFLIGDANYGDTGKYFSAFRDNMHSLNRFGEPAWWLPTFQTGTAGYFYSILNDFSFLSPCAVVTGLLFLFFGKVGIFVKHFQPFYVLYYGFLIPTVFLISARLFLWRIFSNSYLRGYVLILAAFSPGVSRNVSDIGVLENLSYALFFMVAFFDWIRRPNDRSSFIRLLLTIALLSIVNVGTMRFNLFAIPLFLVLWYIFLGRSAVQKARTHLSPVHFMLMALVALICFSPVCATIFQGGDLIRASLGESKIYPYARLLAGAPVEFLASSLPGFGFDWNEFKMLLIPITDNRVVGYYYLGILALPLLFFGFIHGNPKIAKLILLFLGFFSLFISLSAYSPFFGALLLLPTPLRSNNHFSDQTYHCGVFLIVIFGAALGLKAYLQKASHRSLFRYYFYGSSAFTFFIFILFHGKAAWQQRDFNLFVAECFFVGIVLNWLAKSTKPKESRWLIRVLLFLTLVDVGTFSSLWTRHFWAPNPWSTEGIGTTARVDETPADNGVGLKDESHSLLNALIMYRAYFRLKVSGLEPTALPKFRFFTSVRPEESIVREVDRFHLNGFAADLQLPVDTSQLADPRFQSFLNGVPTNLAPDIRMLKETYNTVEFKVWVPVPGILFFRDGYSPYWNGKVDGVTEPVQRAFFNYKSIFLNSGIHTVNFTFSPPLLPALIALSYGLIFLLALASVFSNLIIQWLKIRWRTTVDPIAVIIDRKSEEPA